VFYISVTNLAVPDSFYYLPDETFRSALIRLSLLSGAPSQVYEVLKKDPLNSWNKSIAVKDVNLVNIARYYHLTGHNSWFFLQSGVKSWNRYVPVIEFNTDNQFHRWLIGTSERGGVLSGEFGISSYSGRKVWDELKNPLKITALIALFSLVISVFISVVLALWLSNKGRFVKVNIVSPLFLSLYSLPVFWIGTWLLYLFANPYGLQLFPASGYYGTGAENSWMFYLWLSLPVFCNSFSAILFLTRLLTEGFSDEYKSDYTRTALAKGVSLNMIRRKHQLKNLMFPALAVIAGSFPVMMNGSVLIEQVFSIPGLGSLMIRAVQTRDFPLLTGFFLITGILTVVVFQLIDTVGRLLDPRIRVASHQSSIDIRQ
jgi:peptide/nickel transport system permease protein